MPALVELDSIDAVVEVCLSVGLSFVELNLDLPYCHPDNNPADALLRLSRSTGVGFTIHFPEQVELGSAFESVRRGWLEALHDVQRWGAAFNASVLVVHMQPGVYFTLPDGRAWVNERFPQAPLDSLVSSLSSLASMSQGSTCVVAFENVTYNQYVGRAYEILLDLGGWYTWDVGHDAVAGFGCTPLFERRLDRLRHMHLHDSDGTRNHLTLFDGSLDIARYLGLAKERQASVVIETKTADAIRASVARLRERGLLD
jgi:sugar phosphate isomerase/epimerase